MTGGLVGGPGRRVVVACATAGAALALVAAAFADQSPLVTSPNWSGYLVTGKPSGSVSYTGVTGTWTVPTATCGNKLAAGGSSTVWIGLGGYTTKDQEEVGTDSNCNAKDQPIYYAWFELLPYIAFNVFPTKTDVVQPGDTMVGLVKSLAINLVEVSITDQTRNWTFERNITYSSQDLTTAEWMVEAPSECLYYVCHQANLTNFDSVTMHDLSATTSKGDTGNLNDSDWQVIPIQMVPGPVLVPNLEPEATTPNTKQTASSPAGAQPSQPSSDGSSFNIQWVPNSGV